MIKHMFELIKRVYKVGKRSQQTPSIRVETSYILVNNIKSKYVTYNSLTLVSSYFPLSKKLRNEFQDYSDTFSDQTRSCAGTIW
jgi:hypothetical protein